MPRTFPGLVHADFVIGDRDGTTADPALSRRICEHLRGFGYNVSTTTTRTRAWNWCAAMATRRASATASRWRSTAGSTWTRGRCEPHAGFEPLRDHLRQLVELSAWHRSARSCTDGPGRCRRDRRRRRRAGGRARAGAGRAARPSSPRRRPAIGQGVSSRNSEVIHAGLYYTPGSLKARLCVRGKELLYALCASHGVDHRRCGKLIVANSDAEAAALRGLQERAVANGVPVRVAGRAAGPGAGAGAAVRGRLASRRPRASSTATASCWRCRATWRAPAAWWRWAPRSTSAVLSDRAASRTWCASPTAASSAARVLVNAASLHACALARRFDGLDPQLRAARVVSPRATTTR